MAGRVEDNLDNRPDIRVQEGKDSSHLPRKGVDDQVTINPKERYRDSQDRVGLRSTVAFHELAEAFAKVDGGKQYGDTQTIYPQGETLVVGPPQGGPIVRLCSESFKLREQRPSLRETGSSGGEVIRDTHN